MRVVEDFPHDVHEIENCWIPMSDGCRLAARIWLPQDAATRPVPAIVEYIPYRKRDRTRWRDEPMHAYFAGHGYAAIRIDLRGCGDSDGIMADEYHEQELQDGLEAIRWLSEQPWCSGEVGMMGKSWGGFNSLQIAARRPPALRAVLAVCATDDRYADDAHYMGGCLLNENLIWGSVLMTINAHPPDPAIVGERWREMWQHRLQSTPLFPARWLRHQRRDDYWRHGSVCEEFSRLACPVYAISGWADGYSSAVPRLLRGLCGPRKGLIGPWAHLYPHQGVPGPAIGFLQEALRWWDHWLKGIDTGIMAEPMFRVWMQETVAPSTFHEQRPGRWVAEASWPSPDLDRRAYSLGDARAVQGEGEREFRASGANQTVGLGAGMWCGFGYHDEAPADQTQDDEGSLVFDLPPLTETVEILGAPIVTLRAAANRRQGIVAVRLSDVRPDGGVLRVSYGMLNLTHREGHERPRPLVPGETETIRVRLRDAAHTFRPGHRMRVSISTAYWPLAWPSPQPLALDVRPDRSRLEVPVRLPREADDSLPPFAPPEGAAPPDSTEEHDGEMTRRVRRDSDGTTHCEIRLDEDAAGLPLLAHLTDIDLTLAHAVRHVYSIRPDDPLSAKAEITHDASLARGDWSVRVRTRVRLTADEDTFRIEATLAAEEGDRQVFSREWDERVPRDLV